MSSAPYGKSMACLPRWTPIIRYIEQAWWKPYRSMKTPWTEWEKEMIIRFTIISMQQKTLWPAPLLYILSELPSSADIFRFPHIPSVETLTTGTILVHFPPCLCNLLYDVWVGWWVFIGYIRARVNTPPSPSCSQGPKPCWMMGNRESREKIKGKQSLKSPRWTQCPSNVCMHVRRQLGYMHVKQDPPTLTPL